VDFKILLDCLEGMSEEIKIELIVVANSKSTPDNQTVSTILNNYNCFYKRHFIEGIPGLPRSRNKALQAASGQFVTFLDDDIEITSSYFKELEKVFSSNNEIVGVAPFIDTKSFSPQRTPTKQKVSRKLRKRSGKISKSGSFFWLSSPQPTLEVSWLPGCAMSYRREAIGELKFNQNLEKGITGGYALGEDADFSLKMSECGKLIGLGSETAIHKLSAISRA
jgi:cellulose synthase/poly-beta-1,6-N-acetylglucosamine synthase-like glycosyltransferase